MRSLGSIVVASLVFVQPCSAGTWAENEAKIAACFAAMDRDPALDVVNAKFARGEPSEAQLGDAHFANEAEAEALRLRVKKTRPCRLMRLEAVKTHHPLLEPAYATLYYQADQVFDYLGQGFISFGDANQLARAALRAFRAREQAYFAAGDDARRALSQEWSEALQRAHSNPPPSSHVKCAWDGLNLLCL